MVVRYRFKLQKLERPIVVRNVNGTNNSVGATTHQVEMNVYYKGHVKRIKINVCNLERTDIILGMLWLQVYNLEINWEIEEVKMTRCLLLYERNIELKEEKRRKRVVTLEEKKIVRWTVDNKEDWEREEVEVDYRKIEEMVL